jgi:hypothetical protein
VRQVGYLPELYEDARSEKYKCYSMRLTVTALDYKMRLSELLQAETESRSEI